MFCLEPCSIGRAMPYFLCCLTFFLLTPTNTFCLIYIRPSEGEYLNICFALVAVHLYPQTRYLTSPSRELFVDYEFKPLLIQWCGVRVALRYPGAGPQSLWGSFANSVQGDRKHMLFLMVLTYHVVIVA